MTTNIGLDQGKSVELAEKLNALLANYQVFYMNVRGYHWNITGPNFFELHAKFEEIYDDLVIKIDEIAERILTLGQRPLHAFADYLAVSEIKSHTNAVTDQETLQGTMNGFKSLLILQRDILGLAAEADDEGTASQMSDYIKEQEKLIWMLNATSVR